MKNRIAAVLVAGLIGLVGTAEGRDAPKTRYPIVFAHGMAGFDDILGYDYWGDDYGVFVLDSCQLFEINGCNGDITDGQASFVASVTPFQSSTQRGYELYQDISGYMASAGVSYVNIIGHSQGGLDLRNAAKRLQSAKGYTVVKYGISLSSPHRGSPIAKWVLDGGLGSMESVAATLAEFYGGVVYGAGNDVYAALKQLVYNDYSSTDGVTTGMASFNSSNQPSTTYIARAGSLITGQGGLDMNPALYLVQQGFMNIKGDGYGTTDSDNDGALGGNDTNAGNDDDDGLVGVNSQQMGFRMERSECILCLDYVYERNVSPTYSNTNLNAPSTAQQTSHYCKINQDHMDVIGVGPDMFDEMEFYAAITERIALVGY